MAERLRAIPGSRMVPPTGFEVAYAGPDGDEVRRTMGEAVNVPFERLSPVRSFPAYRGQRNYPGFYWSSSSGAHVGYESWLERDEAMAMDFDPTVVAFAAQPFWLFWPEGGRVRSHAPDFFAHKADGTGVVVDCRPASRVKPRDAAGFEATAQACADIGWGYRLVHGHEAVWLANVQWLAGYRHPRHLIEPVAAGLVEVFLEPMPLMKGAETVGDPIAVLPTLFHLLWSRRLDVDLAVRLDSSSLVRATS